MIADHDFWVMIRRALLIVLDAIEQKIGICPTTADIRKDYKERNCA